MKCRLVYSCVYVSVCGSLSVCVGVVYMCAYLFLKGRYIWDCVLRRSTSTQMMGCHSGVFER